MIGRAAPSPLLVPPSSAVDWFRCVSGWASALAPEGKGKQGRLRSKVLAGLCFSPGNRRRRVPAERSRAASSSALPRGAGRFPSVSYFASGAGGDGVWRQGRGGTIWETAGGRVLSGPARRGCGFQDPRRRSVRLWFFKTWRFGDEFLHFASARCREPEWR